MEDTFILLLFVKTVKTTIYTLCKGGTSNWFHEHPLLMLSHRIYLVLKEGGKKYCERILEFPGFLLFQKREFKLV